MSQINFVFQYWDLMYYEISLIALWGFLIGGIDDFAVDFIWLMRTAWRRLWIFRRHERATVETLPSARHPGDMAVFVAAWDEADVITPMLQTLLSRFGNARFHVFLGCYPNDTATAEAAASLQSLKITIAINPHNGPTTKADCLNTLWRSMEQHEIDHKITFKSILLHDAEDVVHSAEPKVFDALIERFELVQIPVLPLPDQRSRWISGHYCDEFAESHAKSLVVREAIGAAIPSAGVGCAFSRSAIAQIAKERGGDPFDDDSLTEDYELGLRIKAAGGKTVLVRLREYQNGPLVAIRAHFPTTLDESVRQKTRWIIGIALAGWDRLGWQANFFENWMRLRDRRAPFSAIILCVGYAALIMAVLTLCFSVFLGIPVQFLSPKLNVLLLINSVLLTWRIVMRFSFVTHEYDLAEGLRSIPRIFIGNVIAIIAARRAVAQYAKIHSFKDLKWDKTQHKFPNRT